MKARGEAQYRAGSDREGRISEKRAVGERERERERDSCVAASSARGVGNPASILIFLSTF